MDKDLQVENGNFTRIVNPLIEELIKIPFKGCELAVALFIIRKTYGYQKKQDEISLSQFCSELKRARSTINLALKTLQVVGILKLVRRGNHKGASNVWAINKYYKQWNLVRLDKLVRQKRKPSMTEAQNLVREVIHTKEITKEKQKKHATKIVADDVEIILEPSERKRRKKQDIVFNPLGAEIINAFAKTINPSCARYYNNTTQRSACDGLIKTYGLEKVLKAIEFLPQTNNEPFFPKIYNPLELYERYEKLRSSWIRRNKEHERKNPEVII